MRATEVSAPLPVAMVLTLRRSMLGGRICTSNWRSRTGTFAGRTGYHGVRARSGRVEPTAGSGICASSPAQAACFNGCGGTGD